MAATLPLNALLTWAEEEAQKWQEFFRQHPEAMNIKTDIAHTKDVRGLLVHIFVVDRAYNFRMQGQTANWDELAARAEADPFATGEEARKLFRELLASGNDAALDEVVTFGTLTSGQISATRRKMLTHTLLHGIRHWAQLATLIRQHGLPDPGKHDFLFSGGMK